MFWNCGKLLHVWVASPSFTLHLFVSSCTSGRSPSEKLPGDQSMSEHEPHGQHQPFPASFQGGPCLAVDAIRGAACAAWR